MTFPRVVAESGLTKAELAQLYGVSRRTIYCWLGDSPAREGSLLARQAAAITTAIMDLIASKRLSLGVMTKQLRRLGIARLAAVLQDLKPVPSK